MNSMQLYHDETLHTCSESSLVVEDGKIYQIIDRTKDFHSREQLAKIVENLTLEKGFMLDSDTNKYIVLKNPTDPQTSYTFDLLEGWVSRRDKKFLGKVE